MIDEVLTALKRGQTAGAGSFLKPSAGGTA